MEERSIEIGEVTKQAHGTFIMWLNNLLNHYVGSFYDDAIKNIIMLSFIREHYSFMVEMYQEAGTLPFGFITILPTDSTNSILMVHNGTTGNPYLYNKEDIANILEFDEEGKPTRFFENIVIPLYDEDGAGSAECFISYRDYYGIKAPFITIRYIGSITPLCTGLLDLAFEGRYSGTYMVQNKPLSNEPKYVIKNISLVSITLDIPVLRNFTIQYKIKSGDVELVPITPFTEGYIKNAKTLGNIEVSVTQ